MIGTELELDELESERFRLKRQLQVVNKKISGLISKNSSAFSSQVEHYAMISAESHEILHSIIDIRR
jgi:hypothetical protein